MTMRKIAINQCYGGFSLSNKATVMLHELTHPGVPLYFYRRSWDLGTNENSYARCPMEDAYYILTEDFGEEFTVTREIDEKITDCIVFNHPNVPRHDENLIKVIKTLGKEADGDNANIVIVEIDDDDKYIIEEHDGYEGLELRSQVDDWDWQ